MTVVDETISRCTDVRELAADEQSDVNTVKAWRKATRQALLAQRLAVTDADHYRWSAAIHHHLAGAFRDVETLTIAFYWPYQREFDAAPLVLQLLAKGATCALPVVVAPRTPLVFRQWQPDTPMTPGVYDIPIPVGTREVLPDVVLAPLNGFDPLGFRLGYGSGYFDRTLAALNNRPTSIGIGFDLARLASIYPQPHDVPLDFIVTELGIHRSRAGGLQLGLAKTFRHFMAERGSPGLINEGIGGSQR